MMLGGSIDIAKIIHVFRMLHHCFHACFLPNSYVNSAKLVYFAILGNFGHEIQKSIKKRVKSVKRETFVNKSENRVNLPSKLEDLLSKTQLVTPQKLELTKTFVIQRSMVQIDAKA